jgi:DNA helicase-2/ATP-dependent DNA helicase PcrA
MEEERRLAYVAITRARRHLTMTHTMTRQIFGMTRLGRPSRFLGNLPPDVFVEKRTRGAASTPAPERFVDRVSASRELVPMPAWRRGPSASGPSPSPSSPPSWRSSFETPASASGPLPGERFVDTDFFSDDAPSAADAGAELRRGSRVFHTRFGNGEVRSVVNVGEPAVVAFFPGWGEKKVLARFLKLAR